MRQVRQIYRTGALSVADVPAPRAGHGRLLVATRVSLISSGTEKQLLDLARTSLAGKAMARPDLVRKTLRSVRHDGLRPTIDKVLARLDTPIPLGYSLAGVIMETGSGVTGFTVGDRVACSGAGYANHAEINAIPKNLAVRIPDNVDDASASFAGLGAIALQGVRLTTPALGETVVVIGLGLIGLLTVQLLKANGCRVLGIDPDTSRAGLARTLGADLTVSDDAVNAIQTFTAGLGADAVIVTAATSSSGPINAAAELCRLKGRIVVVGMVGLNIDREPFYRREIELKLSMSSGPGRYDPNYEQDGHDYPAAYVRWTEQRNMEAFLRLVADGKVTPLQLITHRFAIDDAVQAYDLMQRREPHLAILLTYPEPTNVTPLRVLPIEASPRPKDPPNGIAFIGFGNYARSVLLPAIRATMQTTLTTVVTSSGISADHAANKYGFSKSATDPSLALSDPDTDIVFIATRHNTHATLAAQALHAGKHVFCEKPLALAEEELADVTAAARRTDRILTVGFNRRFAPLLQDAKAALRPRTGPLAMLYRINAGQIASDHWTQRAEGGGRILGEVCHFVDTLSWLADSLPVEIYAADARGHNDVVSVVLRFAGGSTGTIVYTALGDTAVAKEYIEVFADGCVVQVDDFQRLTISRNGRARTRKAKPDKGQKALIRAFLDAARNRSKPPIPLDEIIAVTDATLAISDSVRTGCPVRLEGGVA